jgi:hypothetical protein
VLEFSVSGAPRTVAAGNRVDSENHGIIGKAAHRPQDVTPIKRHPKFQSIIMQPAVSLLDAF